MNKKKYIQPNLRFHLIISNSILAGSPEVSGNYTTPQMHAKSGSMFDWDNGIEDDLDE